MTEEELARSPVIRMAGSDGEIYEATADLASEMATAAREAGVALKPFVKTTDAEGNLHEISPFDGAALKEAEERGDKRHFEGNAEEDYFSAEALKAGAARFAIGIVNPLDWLRGIGTATGTVVRGLAKGTVGLVLKAGSALETAGASIDDAIHNAELEEYKRKSGYSDKEWERILKERPEEFGLEKREEGAFHKAERKFNEIVDAVTPDVFELTGEYDGVDGAKESTGAVRSVAEMVANVKGIGKLTNLMQANGASARLAHAATGAMFGAGKYDDVANDPNGPGGWKQQAAAIAAGTADAVIFGLWNPFKISAKYAAELKPFAEATRREVTKRVLVRLGQAFESGASMATVEAVKQGAEQLAGIGMTTDGASGGPEPLPEDEATKTWGERTLAESAKEVGAQFLVGSAFAALDVAEANIGRFSYNRVRKAQGEDIGEGMKVAMSYQVERNRKAICPKYHEQAIYAYNMFVKQGGRSQSFRDGFSMGPDVRRINEDGSVVFDDGSVWRADPRMKGGATITVSDGTILSETGELLGYRARRESGDVSRGEAKSLEERVDEISEQVKLREEKAGTETGTDGASGGSEPLPKDGLTRDRPESNALLLLQQIDEGKLPVEEVAIGDVEAIAPTENGNFIEEYDAAKAKPIVVWEDLEGNRHAVTGGKRLLSADASGAETIKAVVVREADGWSEADARGLGATENLREGHGTIKNVVDAVETLGEDKVAELAGWHQANGSRDFASTLRKGLAVAQKGAPELKQALAEDRIGEDFAYNAAQVLSMERLGEGWEAAQRELAGLIGKVGPEELEAVLWGLKGRITPGGAGESGQEIDWKAAIAEERAKYNAKKGGADGKLDSDAVLMETEDKELKTLGEVEAENGEKGNSDSSETSLTLRQTEGNEGEAPNFAAAQGAAENKAVELRPAGDKPGVFTTLSHPEARFTVQGDASTAAVRTLAVEGLTEADFEPGRIGQTAALIAKVEAYAANHLMKIAFGDDGVQRLWETVRENIKAEGKEAYSAAQIESKRKAVLEQLKKSGLAEEVVESAEEFRRLYEEMNGEPLRRGEEVYGFCDPKTKKIYLNPEFFATQQGLEVPIHEFGHLGVIACEKVNKAVYDQGMKLAKELLESGAALATGTDGASGAPEPLPKEGATGVRGLVDFILKDRVYSKQSREVQAQELLAQLIGKRGEEALKAETNKSVVAKVKSWLVEFWNTFGKALGLKDITPEEAAKMTVEDVADAIRAEMLSGRKYGEGFDRVEFSGGGARVKTKPVRIKRKMTGRRKAVNDFVARMGGAEDPTNTETDLLALWVDNGGRLFEKIPYALESGYSKGASGVKKVRSAVDDEFVESTSFYKDLNAAQRKVYFGTGKQEYGSVGGTLMERLEEAGITRFTGEDGMVDFNALIGEFERQWTNYERGEAFLKERGEWAEEHDRAIVEEMERAEAAERAELEAIFGKDEGGAAVSTEEAAAQDAQMAADLEAGMFSRKGGLLFSRFAGEKGTANMGVGNADRARSMESEGADREKIWRETGWWKGKDGKWRFELPNVRMKGEEELESALLEGVTGLHDGSSETTLEKVLEAPELFTAYPQLKDTKIVFSPEHDDKSGGWYNKEKNEIVILDTGFMTFKRLSKHDKDLYDTYQRVIDSEDFNQQRLRNMDALGIEHGTAAEEREHAKKWIAELGKRIQDDNAAMVRNLVRERGPYSTFGKIVHEVQHAIQGLEGFAKGGSPESADALVKNMKRRQRIWAYRLEVEETAKELGTTNPYEIEKAILGKLGVTSREQVAGLEAEGWIPDKAGRDKGYNLFARGYDKEGYEEAYDKYLGEMRKSGRASWWDGSPNELYNRLAGEVEARNASRREAMSPEERAATPPWETEDVPQNRQLLFARAVINGRETAVANGYPLSIREARDPDKVLKVLSPLVGKSAAQIGEMKLTRISEASVKHLINSEHARQDIRAGGRDRKKLWRGSVAGMSVTDDIVATSSIGTAQAAKHLNADWKKGATFYEAKTRFAVEVENGKYEVYPCKLIVSEINGERQVYDLTEIGTPTPTTSVSPKTATVGGPQRGLTANGGVGALKEPTLSASAGKANLALPQGRTRESASSSRIVPNSGAEAQGGAAKFAARMPSQSGQEYTYAALTAKPDMPIVQVDAERAKQYGDHVSWKLADARKSILAAGGRLEKGHYIIDMEGEPVEVGKKGLLHGKHNRNNDFIYPVLGEVLKNAVRVNELDVRAEFREEGKKDDQVNSKFIYLGAAAHGDVILPVRIQIDRKAGRFEIGEIDVLKSINAKMARAESPAEADLTGHRPPNSLATVSISNLIGIAQPLHPQIFSKDVAAALNKPYQGGEIGALFSRGGKPPEAEHVKLTRVADDAGQGEQTPGAMAASRELSRQGAVPINTKGTRYVSLPMSEMNALARYLTGHALPAEMESGRKLGTAGKASYKHRKLTIAADVLGVVDKTDMAAEKAMLKQHGFFAHEDSNWCATHSPAEVRKERERSEEALSSQLEKIADKRIAGREPGGMAAGRKVFADQLAQVVMAMPHGQPGALGAMQTVAGALEKRVRGSETEAETFLDWMEGVSPGGAGASGRPARSGQERKAGMFAAFLIMPKEMEARAKGWYDAIRSTIAGDQKLADAFRKMTARMMSEQGHAHLESEILRMQDAQTEAAIKKLQAEANEPIKAGGKLDQAKETVVLSCDDRMGAAVVRVDAAAKVYLAAQKRLMAAAKTPAEKAQIKQQTDVFMGQLAQAKNQAELSRTAWERGRNNADARYLWRMVDLLNEATVRDGLRVRDLSLYLDQMRVIETRGLSGSRGESARQAQLIIDTMRKRLGADFAKVEAFARRFHAIHEQELLNNPLLEKILGKGTADYWRSQTSYVTTKRTFSPEELAEIEAARRTLAASGAAGGDTVVGQMFKYCGRPEATAKLKGSFADKQEVMSATFEKVAEVQRFLRRSEYVIRLRDMLKLANVEGVHDMPAGKNEFKSNNRYGSISYMENGQKRTLVVPREIADGFDRQSMYNSRALKICAAVNNIARQLWIDWNPVYWHRNLSRNAGSIEMNMPGMRESIIKRGARFVFPGLAPVTEMAMTHLVRHLPERMSLGLLCAEGEAHGDVAHGPQRDAAAALGGGEARRSWRGAGDGGGPARHARGAQGQHARRNLGGQGERDGRVPRRQREDGREDDAARDAGLEGKVEVPESAGHRQHILEEREAAGVRRHHGEVLGISARPCAVWDRQQPHGGGKRARRQEERVDRRGRAEGRDGWNNAGDLSAVLEHGGERRCPERQGVQGKAGGDIRQGCVADCADAAAGAYRQRRSRGVDPQVERRRRGEGEERADGRHIPLSARRSAGVSELLELCEEQLPRHAALDGRVHVDHHRHAAH